MRGDFGSLTAIMIGCMFQNAQPILLAFPTQLPVFRKETSANMYSPTAYFVSKTVVEMPLTFMQCCISFGLTYYFIGYNAGLGWLLLAAFWLGMSSASLSTLISAVSTTAEQALQLSPITFVPQILFSGVFVPVSSLPTMIQPLQYLCPLKYAVNMAAAAEFSEPDPQKWGAANWAVRQGYFTREINIVIDDENVTYSVYRTYVVSVGAMALIFLVIRSLACFVLWRNSEYLY